MHPYVKLHKLPGLIAIFLLLIMVCPVASTKCKGPMIRKMQLYSDFTHGKVWVNGKNRVDAKGCLDGSDDPKCDLQIITLYQHYFLIYHPTSDRFICFNRLYTNMVARPLRSLNVTHCLFEEKISLQQGDVNTRYIAVNGSKTGREIEMRFTKHGHFAKPKNVRSCLAKRHSPREVASAMSVNPENLQRNTPEFEAYVHVTKECANPDFLKNYERSCMKPKFCNKVNGRKQMRHPHKLKQFCNNYE